MTRPMAYYHLTPARQRRGLSYLEVLIAAGIGLAGLLGAIAIFPVAILNLQRGVVADTTAYIGPSALEQAQGTGMLDRSNWLGYNVSTKLWNAQATTYLSGYPASVSGSNTGIALGPWCSVCIDPRFCAELDTSSLPANVSPGYFPYVLPGATDARMIRVTLQVAANTPMSVNQARLLFKVADDVIAIKPDDATSPATLAPLFGKSNTPVRRDYMGDFEWMITLSPKMNGVMATNPSVGSYVDSNGNATGLPFMSTNQYLASVVVFHQRQPRLDAVLDATSTDPATERVVNVTNFYSGGFNGGDVQIQSSTETDLILHAGDWVMLSGIARTPSSQAMGPLFQWYRVAALQGEAEYNGTNYQRYVTLEGADWPVKTNAAGAVVAGGLVTGPTQMTIVSGVVGVFEHTVTVDN